MSGVRIADCVDAVREAYGLTRAELLASRRRHAAKLQMVMWLARRHTPASFPTIGAALAHRHHTTIMHGIAAHERRMAADADLAARTREIEAKLGAAS